MTNGSSAFPRLLFFHSEVRSYRVPIFDKIANNYDCTFVFLHPTREAFKTPEASKWKFTYLRSVKLPGYAADACPGAISYLIKNRHLYDAVIFSGIFSFTTHIGVPLARLLGKKVIIWDETWLLPKNLGTKIIQPYLRYLIKLAHSLIGAGSKARQFYRQMGASDGKIATAPNCAKDLLPLIDQSLAKRLASNIGLKSDSLVIGYLGRVVRYKALDTLIDSYFRSVRPKFAQTQLLIVGDGPFAPNCRAQIASYGGTNTIWVGGDPKKIEPISHQEFVNYLSLVDIFVLPGRFVWEDNVPAEAWGLILNEAMSLGKPVISTTSVAGAFDLIENGINGYLVEQDNVDQLSEALVKLVSKKALRHRAGQKSREIMDDKFDYEQMYQGFRQAISCSFQS